ncbi:MAG: DUF1048 domain-containing protein, partial [Erysipelotrichia bacterium]|nr:DUF1048 domain-containing protein [Erysipelotrichia bacterium]
MSVNEKKINVDENVERIAALPEEYVKAVEDVVGNLDPDWRNKLVYNKYIAYLCDVFEDAVKKGLSVNEVIGDDRKAYADKIQAELKFMDITPTNKNKITNYLIIFDFIMYIGMSVFSLGAKNFSHAQTMDYVLMAIGAIVMFACMMMKLVKVKAMKNMAIIP